MLPAFLQLSPWHRQLWMNPVWTAGGSVEGSHLLVHLGFQDDFPGKGILKWKPNGLSLSRSQICTFKPRNTSPAYTVIQINAL